MWVQWLTTMPYFLTAQTGLRPGDGEVILKGQATGGSLETSRLTGFDVAASDAVTVKSSGGVGNGGN